MSSVDLLRSESESELEKELEKELENERIANKTRIEYLMKDIGGEEEVNEVDYSGRIKELFGSGNYHGIQEIFGLDNCREIDENKLDIRPITSDKNMTISEAIIDPTTTIQLINNEEKNDNNCSDTVQSNSIDMIEQRVNEENENQNNKMEIWNMNLNNNKMGGRRFDNLMFGGMKQSQTGNPNFFRARVLAEDINPISFKLFTEDSSLLQILHILEESALNKNEFKLDAIWRKNLSKMRTKLTKNDKKIAEDTCLRILSSKDRTIELLCQEIEDFEEQYRFCYGRHIEFLEKIGSHYGFKKESSALMKYFYETIDNLRDHFEELHRDMLERHEKSMYYVEDVTYAMTKDKEDIDMDQDNDMVAIKDETKTRHLEQKHQLQIRAEQQLDSIWKQFFELMKKDKVMNGERRTLLKEYMTYDDDAMTEIRSNQQAIDELTKNIGLFKKEMERRKETFELINELLVDNRIRIVRHYRQLKIAVNRMLVVLDNRLKNLSVTSEMVIRRLENTIKEGEKTAALARLSNRLSKKEDISAFQFETHRTGRQAILEYEHLNKSLHKLDKSLSQVKDFYMEDEHFSLHWLKENKVRFDIVLLKRERDKLLEEKRNLTDTLEDYITRNSAKGISIFNDEVPLFRIGRATKMELHDTCHYGDQAYQLSHEKQTFTTKRVKILTEREGSTENLFE
ncbi:hypothetical protein SNEBB_007050 [Seison nebaliae]|nr:hypothetical protein SNEBB_007050 [Seison nebaliae]